jgi:Uma2 family endonuclease
MTIATAKWSLQDYHQMIEVGLLDERKVELVNGEIIEMSPEGAPHSSYCGEIAEYLRKILGDRAKVREAHPITLANNSEPEPDIAIVRNRFSVGEATPTTLYRDRHPYPEDILWLIEVANSTLVKDLGMKRDLYASAEIEEYWVLNLQTSTLVVFRDLTKSGYQSETTFTTGIIFPLAFPDLSIDIQQLLA